jgi:hypothetical protein
MVILSFFVIKLYCPGNYHGMTVNYHGILTLEKVGLEVRGNLPSYCFITLAPEVEFFKLKTWQTPVGPKLKNFSQL